MNQKIKAVLGFLVSGAVLTAIDQWTKSLAVAGLKGKEPFVNFYIPRTVVRHLAFFRENMDFSSW